jgi:hypothetical protein
MLTRALIVAIAAAGLPGAAGAAETVLWEDDFEAPALNAERWSSWVSPTPGSLVRVEGGVLHVLGVDAGAGVEARGDVPALHCLEFDYLQPAGERAGGYQNNVSCAVTRKAPGQTWDGAVWYLEASGSAYSYLLGTWQRRGGGPRFPPRDDRWYRVRVLNQDTAAAVLVSDRGTGELCWRANIPHDPIMAGRIRFDAAADGQGSRWGFMLDNVRVSSLEPSLAPALEPLSTPAETRPCPPGWRPLSIAGRSFWHLVEYRPQTWAAWGMRSHPLFSGAAWLHAPSDETLITSARRPYTLRPALDEEGKRLQARIVGATGDRFLGFYDLRLGPGGPLNEWGDGLLRTDMKDWLGGPIRDRDEGLARLRRCYEDLADTVPAKRAVLALDGYRVFHHHAFEWGAQSVVAEIGENIPCTNLQLAFARGAGREYGKPWGLDLSSWFDGTVTDYGSCDDTLTADVGPFSGHSLSLHKRYCYAAWLSGANFLWFENPDLLVINEAVARRMAGYDDAPVSPRWRLSPVGEVAERVFRLAASKDRGVPYTPVAVIVDFAFGWSPAGCTPHRIWGRLPLGESDHMLDQFFNTIYPWNPPGGGWEGHEIHPRMVAGEQGYLTPTPYGEIFDALTTRTCRSLDRYQAAVMVGDTRVDRALADRLQAFVRQGGTLVINVRQIGEYLPESLLGVQVSEEVKQARTTRCALDGRLLESEPFDYTVVTLAGAEPVATSGDGDDVLASVHRVGKGQVLLTTPHYLLDRGHQALPLLADLLDHLTSRLLPLRVSPGLQYMVNRTPGGWVVGLFNNRGAYKRPKGFSWVNQEEAVPTLVELRGPGARVEEWVTGGRPQVESDAGTTRIRLSVPPGDVRVLRIVERR